MAKLKETSIKENLSIYMGNVDNPEQKIEICVGNDIQNSNKKTAKIIGPNNAVIDLSGDTSKCGFATQAKNANNATNADKLNKKYTLQIGNYSADLDFTKDTQFNEENQIIPTIITLNEITDNSELDKKNFLVKQSDIENMLTKSDIENMLTTKNIMSQITNITDSSNNNKIITQNDITNYKYCTLKNVEDTLGSTAIPLMNYGTGEKGYPITTVKDLKTTTNSKGTIIKLDKGRVWSFFIYDPTKKDNKQSLKKDKLMCLHESTTHYKTDDNDSSDNYWKRGKKQATAICFTSSDIRLKQNIYDSKSSGLKLINKIQLKEFDWKESKIHQPIGFIADELEKLDPLLASGGGYDENGTMITKIVDSFYLQGYEVKAIQELYQENQKLKKQLIDLTNRVKSLENKN